MSLEKIKKQVEFYFSDTNYRDDKFLKQQSLLNDGYVPISVIITFKRLRSLEADIEKVKQACADSDVVEIKDDCIKKIETEEYKKMLLETDVNDKCLFISGFNVESDLEDLEAILSPHMSFVAIRMRKDKTKKFNGTAFVELKSKEDVEKCLKLEILPYMPSEENVKRKQEEKKYLEIMPKTEFLKNKDSLTDDEAKKNLIRDFTDKLFKFECKNKDFEIHQIKNIIKDVSFVDMNLHTLRFKFKKDFETKTFGENDDSITLTKLTEDEVKTYCNDIKVKSKDKKKNFKNNKNKNFKKDNKKQEKV